MQDEEANPVLYGNANTAWHNDSQTEFTITTPEQLAGLAKLMNGGNDFKGKTVKLGANIMLNDTANWQNWETEPPANEWEPIGMSRYTICNGMGRIPNHVFFSGIFDGGGFAISGVYINGQGDKGHGLFGLVGLGGTIKNLGVVASYVKGGEFVGGLAGENNGTVINSYSIGNVIGDSCGVGGLVGESEGSISGSYSGGNVIGVCQVGGLAGVNGGSITGSHSSASIMGIFGNTVGGLAGQNYGNIRDSYSAGEVTGDSIVGGLIGRNSGNIRDSYSTSKVTGDSIVGGFAGWNNGGTIVNSYSSSKVAGDSITGGFAGRDDYLGTIINSYYDNEASGQSKDIGEIRNNGTGKAEGKTTKEMQSKEFAYSLNVFAGLKSMKAWVYSPGKYPALSSQIATKQKIDVFASGNGTEASPYIISTKKQLEDFAGLVNMGDDFLGKHVKLGADIMLNDTADWKSWGKKPPSGEWKPIGAYSGIEAGSRPFSGTFDGGGFAISGIYINSTKSYQGLFSFVDSSGAIKNLGVAASYVKGGDHVGGFAGKSRGSIDNSYAIARVEGKPAEGSYGGYAIGGLAGESEGIISNSYFSGYVTGYSSVGGFAGHSRDIRNSYFSGTVTGTKGSNVGGLAGASYGSITGSYSTNKVTGYEYVGGLAGTNRGTISSSYFIGDVTGNSGIGGLAGHNYGGTISDSYSIGNVTGDRNATGICNECRSNLVGGIVGILRDGKISNCYFVGKVAGDKNIDGLAGHNYEGTIRGSYYDKEAGVEKNFMDGGKAAADMKKRKTFKGWDFDSVWGINDAANGGYPHLLK